MAAIGFRAH